MLDENLFSLTLSPNTDGTSGVAFTESAATATQGPLYVAKPAAEGEGLVLEEPLSHAQLASVRVVTPKLRLVQLDNPPATLECKSTGRLSWEWSFVWEDLSLEWKRDVVFGAAQDQRGHTLYMVRKPDADWPICVYRPSTSRNSPPYLQILDYQLKRVDIADSKGLEIVILATLASFLDLTLLGAASVTRPAPTKTPAPPPKQPVASTSTAHLAPALAAKPKTPEVVEQTEPNDFALSESIADDLYIQGCLGQLEDRALTFITIRARNAALVPKAVRIAAEVKTRRLKISGEELYQYVKEDKMTNVPHISLGKYGPYTPPAALSSVKIFLSREPLPELQPKAPQRTPSPQPPLPPKQGGKLQKPVKTGWFSGVRPRAMEG